MDAAAFDPLPEDVARIVSSSSVGEVVLLAQQCVRAGSARTALSLCDAARARGLADPALVLVEATAAAALGDARRALRCVDSVLAVQERDAAALHLKAHLLASAGRRAESVELFRRVVEEFPDFPGAQGSIASLLFPGPPYRDVLKRVHELVRPETYLEIGVESGATLALAHAAQVAVGVDPAPLRAPELLPPRARHYRMKSDDFFATESLGSVFGGRPVDLAFIDGMHWFEYALRDFVNVERWSSARTVVVIHDCVPVTTVAARRDRASTFWVGDVWKLLELLLDHRPELEIGIVPTPPSGLVIVRGLDASARAFAERAPSLVSEYANRDYPHVPGAWPSRYAFVQNDDAGLSSLLR